MFCSLRCYSLCSLAALIADVTPTLVHWYRHGQSTALNYRTKLRLISMVSDPADVTPIAGHPFRPLLLVRDKILAAGFPGQNESAFANLGMIGAIGFRIAHRNHCPPKRKILGDNRFKFCWVCSRASADRRGRRQLVQCLRHSRVPSYNRVSPLSVCYPSEPCDGLR